MDVLVTGGAGFIGSHLCDALIAGGNRVAIVDNLSTGKRENIAGAVEAGAELYVADVREQESIQAIFNSVSPEVVFHLAAQVDVRKSGNDPASDANVNVVGTVNLLHCSQLHSTRRFVMVSTGGAIYGENSGIPVTEASNTSPLSPYGQSKLAAEGYVEYFDRTSDVSGVTLRLGNVYGPRQDPHGEGGVVAIFCQRLREGEPPTVFGTGEQTRDFIYVKDVIAAILAAGSSNAVGPFNVGTGEETSILDLIKLLKLDQRGDLKPVFEPARAGEVKRIAIDSSRARNELGWQATTELQSGLQLAFENLQARA